MISKLVPWGEGSIRGLNGNEKNKTKPQTIIFKKKKISVQTFSANYIKIGSHERV